MRRLDSTCDLLSSLATARSFCAATTLALIGSLSAASYAATRFWDGGGGKDTDWTTGANWDLFNTVPTADDAVYFDRGAAFNYTVTFPRLSFRGDVHTQSLWIGANIVTFEPDHLSIGFNVATRLLVGFEANKPALLNMNLSNMSAEYVTIGGYIEDYANGTLNIANNDQLTVTGSTDSNLEFILGYSDGIGTLNLSSGGKVILTGAKGDILLGTYNGAGKVTITGAGSTLSTAAGLWVGENGTGTIDVTAGGQLKSGTTYMGDYTNENGKVTVDGIGSTWTNAAAIYLGDDGHGVLEITSGGTAVFGESYLGKKNSSSGIVLVDGVQSTWTSGNLYVGDEGLGGVQITGGGHVTSLSTRVGVTSTGRGLVTVGPGSTWDATSVVLGDHGQGYVDVVGGGHVNSGNLSVAAGPFGSSPVGEVRVDGAGSLWRALDVRIGNSYGEGLLEITSGGQLSGRSGTVGATPGMITATGSAAVDGAGSLWTLTNDLSIGLGLNGAGSLTITNSGTVNVGGLLKVGPTGEIHGDGNIIGNVQNGGLVSPGASPGALNITGNFTQTIDGLLFVELSSISSFDELFITGNAVLAGTLEVTFSAGYAPSVGHSFDILNWGGSLSGTFATLNLPALTGGLVWNMTELYTTGVISVGLPGDYNNNGVVDGADYVLWRKNDGTPAGYNNWRTHFGQTAGSGAAANGPAIAAVPEATSHLVLVFGILAIFLPRRAVVS